MTINTHKWIQNYNLDTKEIILLILATLHFNKRISDAKYKGQMASLRTGELLRRKKTHHSSINDRWYDHETPKEVYTDIYHFFPKESIPFENLINAISLLTGKNYNFCINYFLDYYITPLFNAWNPEYHEIDFAVYADITDIYLPGSKSTHDCYNCGTSHTKYDKNEKMIKEKLEQFFHSKKKGNLSKVPFHNMKKF